MRLKIGNTELNVESLGYLYVEDEDLKEIVYEVHTKAGDEWEVLQHHPELLATNVAAEYMEKIRGGYVLKEIPELFTSNTFPKITNTVEGEYTLFRSKTEGDFHFNINLQRSYELIIDNRNRSKALWFIKYGKDRIPLDEVDGIKFYGRVKIFSQHVGKNIIGNIKVTIK